MTCRNLWLIIVQECYNMSAYMVGNEGSRVILGQNIKKTEHASLHMSCA